MKKSVYMRSSKILPLLLAAFIGVKSTSAYALCEFPGFATAALTALAASDTVNLTRYLTQELNFIHTDLGKTATKEVANRFDEFNDNILGWLNDWWPNRLLPAMKDMTKQLATSKVDATRQLGSMQDVTNQNETFNTSALKQIDSRRDATPGENTCQLDTMGVGQSKGYRLSRAVARGLAQDAGRDQGNAQGSPGGVGNGHKMDVMYNEYKTLYCDPSTGDQDCSTPGSLAGLNNDLAAFLWDDKQTIDMSTTANQQASKDVTANIAGPFVAEPLPATATTSAQGKEEIMLRRAKRARQNTIYNTVGQMVGMSAGGTGVNTQAVRTAAGTQPTDASTDASYREIYQATTRERFSDPEYVTRMVNYPAATVREHGAVNAMRLQQLSEMYKRTEELVWVEASVLGDMLDNRVPGRAVDAMPLR